MPKRSARFVLIAPGVGEALIARALAEQGDPGTIIKQDRGGEVRRVEVDGVPMIVKTWAMGRRTRRLQMVVGLTPAIRHWRGAARLERAGIRTARCLAIVRTSDPPVETLLMEFLPGESLLEQAARGRLSPRQEHARARSLADLVRAMHARGVGNRDMKPSNLIVLEGLGTIGVIDVGGVDRRPRPIPRTCRVLMAEFLGVGAVPRRTLRMRFLRELLPNAREARRRIWRESEALLRAHGDPTPKVNPLARCAPD